MYFCLQWIVSGLGISSLIAFFLSSNYTCLLLACILALASNILFSARRSERVYFLFFNLTIFFFILGRPTIQLLSGEEWWKSRERLYGSLDSMAFTLTAVLISLVCLRIGVLVAEAIFQDRPLRWKEQEAQEINTAFMKMLRMISLLAFVVCAGFEAMVGLEKVLFMQGREYIEYYSSFSSRLPSFVQSFATMARYALCIFLATMPSKKLAFFPLVGYLALSIPMLLVGVRNETLLRCLFVFLYYFVRDILDGRQANGRRKWIGRVEVTLLIVAVPALLLFSSVYSAIREDREIASKNALSAMRQLIVEQGVTFRIMGNAYDALPEIQTKHFVIGPLLDALEHGTLAQSWFDAPASIDTNSVEKATQYHDFSHSMSYAVLKEEYLAGRGLGSSYILEAYADGGYVGVALLSFALGIVLPGLLLCMKKNWVWRLFALMSLRTIFFIPRSSAMGWLMFLGAKSFWFIVLVCVGLAALASERNHLYISPLQRQRIPARNV